MTHVPTKPELTRILQPWVCRSAALEFFDVTAKNAEYSALRAHIHGNSKEFVPPGRYVRLMIYDELMMSDTPNEWQTNSAAMRYLTGDVLIAGLGIGMMLIPVLQNSAVTNVTVVEKNPDVIQLIEPHIRKHIPEQTKLFVQCEDIFTWNPPRGTRFDSQYFDIWQHVTSDNVEGMSALRRRFGKHLNRKNPNRWVGCWEERVCRHMKRRAGCW